MGTSFPILGVSIPCHDPQCLTIPYMGLPPNGAGNSQDFTLHKLSPPQAFLHALQGSLLSSAGGQEQSLGFGHWDSASAFPCLLPCQYSTLKLNLERASIHLAILCFGSFRLNSHFRALWSEHTLKCQSSK